MKYWGEEGDGAKVPTQVAWPSDTAPWMDTTGASFPRLMEDTQAPMEEAVSAGKEPSVNETSAPSLSETSLLATGQEKAERGWGAREYY